MQFIEPVIIILKNKRTGKYHPAFVSKDIPQGITISEKMLLLYKGHIVAYQRIGYSTFEDAKNEIENIIINEVKESKPCTTDYLDWNGTSIPSDNVYIETDEDGILHLAM